MDLTEPLDTAAVEHIEHIWELGDDTSQYTMPLIRTLRAVRAELGTIEGLLDYVGGLQQLAAEVRKEKLVVLPADPDAALEELRRKFMAAATPITPDPPPVAVIAPTGSNTGHGHVRPRADGRLARCGGPGLCAACSQEAAAMLKAAGGPA